MPTLADTESRDIRNASFNELRNHFIAGRIGEATFRVSLKILGIPPRDIQSEINLAKMEQRPCCRF